MFSNKMQWTVSLILQCDSINLGLNPLEDEDSYNGHSLPALHRQSGPSELLTRGISDVQASELFMRESQTFADSQ